ncbi:MAG: SLC13 family permease [Rickettsiales bacterium]
MISYSWEKISLELTSLLCITILILFFHFLPLLDYEDNILLEPTNILLGFANPALISIVSLLIIGQAIIQSNALNIIPSLLIKLAKNNAIIAILISLIMVISISAFMNNTPVVVIFIPIFAEIAKHLNISPSKIMIPLSYTAILGGMITLIGSSTNLLVSGTLESIGLAPISFFEFIVPGSIMALIGMIYISFILPKILPDRAAHHNQFFDDRPFVSQIIITKESGFDGQKLSEGTLPGFHNITIRAIERAEKTFLPPFQDNMLLQENDILAISGTRETLSKLVYKKTNIFTKNLHIDDFAANNDNFNLNETNLAEIVVAPASRLIGETIKKSGLYSNYNCPVIGIQRKGNLVKSKISYLRLVAGDVLLILGESNKLADIKNNKDVILTKWSAQQINSIAKVIKTLTIFLLVITASALKIAPISIASFTGATLLILFKCINIRQASRAIDRNVALMIVASLAMGSALEVTGGAKLLADSFLAVTTGLSTIGIISLFFLFTAFMTNILSNAATAVLFTPIAANLALKLAIDPKILFFSVIFATNCSFITPIGYQTNLLVMSPGKYKFLDFVKAGIPLAFILCLTYALLITYYF